MILDDGAADRQTEPEAARLRRDKWREELGRHLSRNTAAAIAHSDLDVVAAARRRHDDLPPHAFVRGHGLYTVQDEVDEDLFDLDGVAAHGRQGLAAFQPNRDAVQARLRLEHAHRFAGERAYVDSGF